MRLSASLLLSAVSVFFALPAMSQTAGNIVVDIPGGVTCSTAAHETGFDVSTWKIGGKDPSVAIASGMSGKPQLQDLILTRSVDACSEQLIKSFVSGKVIPTLTLTQYDAAGSGQVFAAVTVTLSRSIIDSYSISGATATRSVETLDIVYSEVCIATVAQNASGVLQPAQKVCYDAVKNRVF